LFIRSLGVVVPLFIPEYFQLFFIFFFDSLFINTKCLSNNGGNYSGLKSMGERLLFLFRYIYSPYLEVLKNNYGYTNSFTRRF